MKGLIEAFTILAKYSDTEYPTHCGHDVLFVNISPNLVSETDRARLVELGFNYGGINDDGDRDESVECKYGDGFYSYKYGSC